MKSFHLLVLGSFLFFLSACQSSSLKYLTTEKGDIIFEDDFSNPPGEWPVYTTTDAASAFTDGKFILWITSPSFTSWAIAGPTFTDVQVEVEASRLGGPLPNMYGLTCRAQEKGDFYFFIISSDGYYAIGMAQGGDTSLLGQDMMAFNPAILQDDGSNHLRFDCIDTTLTGYVNGQMVAVTGDGSFTSGYTGVIAGSFDQGGVVVSFDNFIVYKP
jgi:hypothetical protein